MSIPAKIGPIRSFLNTYSTQITVALFVVATATGVPIFFHLGDRFLKGAHEWLSMAFAVAALLHVARHWRAIVNLARQRRAQALLAGAALSLAAFVVVAGSGGTRTGNPMVALAGRMSAAPLEQLAPALGVQMPHLIQRLEKAGINGVDPALSLTTIAAANGKPVPHLVGLVLKP